MIDFVIEQILRVLNVLKVFFIVFKVSECCFLIFSLLDLKSCLKLYIYVFISYLF